MQPRLSTSTLHTLRGATLPAYSRERTAVGIVHIGPGAFFRAHQAAYVDDLLASDPRWGICAIALKSTGVRDALAPQDGLYVLNELSTHSQMRVIGAIRELLVACEDYERVFARLTAPETSLVTMTVTEKGYCLDGTGRLDLQHPDIAHDLSTPAQPRSLIGVLTQALLRRRNAGAAPFTVLCCDNLAENGPTLRRAVIDFAARLETDLARWIEGEVSFPRTMVDSITPATDDALRARVAQVTGVEDAWPIQREAFKQWVIEDVPGLRTADWPSVGVTLTRDVSFFERAKLRLLNGAHSTLAYAGLLRSHETVADAMQDAALSRYVESMMRDDIAATLRVSSDLDISRYIGDVLDRFRNPGIRHQLAQIAWDGSKKLPVRLMGTIADTMQAGRPVGRLALPLAAWMRFVVRQTRNGVALVDPEATRLQKLGGQCNDDPAHDVALFFGLDSVFGPTLASDTTLRREIESAYQKLLDPHTAL